MRAVSNKIISDDLLKLYSFEGRTKMPFNVYGNVLKLIVNLTTEAFNLYNSDEKDFKAKSEQEVLEHFKLKFIKYAEQRRGKK